MRQSYIYILHFDQPMAHAMHYSGCTAALGKRLRRHAQGHGGVIVREFIKRGIHFTVSSVSICSHAEMRRKEKMLKDLHNGPRYCGICTERPYRIEGTTPVDLGNLTVPLRSEAYQDGFDSDDAVRVRFIERDEPPQTMARIMEIMKKDKDVLGWIPAGGDEGLEFLVKKNQIALASVEGRIIGYAAFTIDMARTRVTVQQCCVEDEWRFIGAGRAMIREIEISHNDLDYRCQVRDDLAANYFWREIGFTQTEQYRHKTSGRRINVYHKPQLIKPLATWESNGDGRV